MISEKQLTERILKDLAKEQACDDLFTRALELMDRHDYKNALINIKACKSNTGSIERHLALQHLEGLCNAQSDEVTTESLQEAYKEAGRACNEF